MSRRLLSPQPLKGLLHLRQVQPRLIGSYKANPFDASLEASFLLLLLQERPVRQLPATEARRWRFGVDLTPPSGFMGLKSPLLNVPLRTAEATEQARGVKLWGQEVFGTSILIISRAFYRRLNVRAPYSRSLLSPAIPQRLHSLRRINPAR